MARSAYLDLIHRPLSGPFSTEALTVSGRTHKESDHERHY